MHTIGPYTHGPYSPVVGAILPVIVVVLLLALRISQGRGHASTLRWYRSSLALCFFAAIGNYVAFGEFRYDSYMNEWDVTHYYTGTKYAAELGYYHQYEAVWLADHDTGLRSTATEVRSLRTYEMIPTTVLLARADEIRGRFSPERWRVFCGDIAWLKVQLPVARWTILTEDHGHNAPPMWTAAVGTLANLLPIQRDLTRWVLLSVDPALLLLALAAMAWAYGFEAAALSAVLLGTHYFFSWGHLKGSVVRTDFVVFAVFAICLLKKERPLVAGLCAAIAACSRAFPAFFLLGPLVLLVSRYVRDRRLDPTLGRFFAACCTMAVAATLFAALYFHGTGIFMDWASKMELHATSHTNYTVGFRTIFNIMLDASVTEHGSASTSEMVYANLTQQEGFLLWVARILVLLPALYFMRFMSPSSAYGFAFVAMFFAVAPVYYYLMVLALPLLYFVAEPAGWSRTLGIAWLLLTGALGYLLYFGWKPLQGFWLFSGHGQTFTTTLFMTCCIALTTLHMIAHAAQRVMAEQRADRLLQRAAGADPLVPAR